MLCKLGRTTFLTWQCEKQNTIKWLYWPKSLGGGGRSKAFCNALSHKKKKKKNSHFVQQLIVFFHPLFIFVEEDGVKNLLWGNMDHCPLSCKTEIFTSLWFFKLNSPDCLYILCIVCVCPLCSLGVVGGGKILFVGKNGPLPPEL